MQQAHDEILRLIDGKPPGEQLPSEAELADDFGVSRGTLREAFKSLEEAGLIAVEHGKGRFVSALAGLRVNRPVTRFESVTEMLLARGYRCTTRVLSVDVCTPTEAERVSLTMPKRRKVVRLRRLRLYEGSALVLSINAFPADFLADGEPEASEFTESLNDWLDARGHRPISSAAQIQACTMPADVGGLPEVDETRPWLLITEQCVDRDGAPVLFSRDFHRGDMFSFHVVRRS